MSLQSRLRSAVAPGAAGRRFLTLGVVSLFSGILLTDFSWGPTLDLSAGDVATTDVVSPTRFRFVDDAATEAATMEAATSVAPVYEADYASAKKTENRVSQAFDMARRRYAAARLDAAARGHADIPPDVRAQIVADFVSALDLGVDAAELQVVVDAGFALDLEELTMELIGVGLRRSIVADRSLLPSPPRPITVVSRLGDSEEETTLESYESIRTPEEARQSLSLYVMERLSGGGRNPEWVKAATAIARAAIAPNFRLDTALTSARQEAARSAVMPVEVEVKKGTRIVRAGDVVDVRQAGMIASLKDRTEETGGVWVFLSWWAFSAILIAAPWGFANTTIRKFAPGPRDDLAMGFTLVLVLFLARILAFSAVTLDLPGTAEIGLLSLLVPVAGGAMLIRILINSESALVFSLVASVLAAAMTDRSALLTAYYMVTAVTAAGGVGPARERRVVLRAGMMAGFAGAGLVLLVLLLRQEGAVTVGVQMAAGAVVAGIIGSVIALGLVPAFEVFGFITDYQLLELTNLNHPLLRQLMLRAPGTYHHSVIVGTLSEAACETVGANALLARVACYFHDIGKGVKPQYFVENQRDGASRHDRLSPEQSAQVIINHVRDGQVLALQYNLPKPILDNIFMHHGTGIIQYFYNKAKEAAAAVPGSEPVDDRLFRYPGPKPDSREAGIIMLADKVEAACRTIREPTEERIRAMIQQIVNSVMTDGQFEQCPLTLKELYQIADTFTGVLLGIYHHRIEYPDTKAISQGKGRYVPTPRQGTITLEIMNPLKPPPLGAKVGAAMPPVAPTPREGRPPAPSAPTGATPSMPDGPPTLPNGLPSFPNGLPGLPNAEKDYERVEPEPPPGRIVGDDS